MRLHDLCQGIVAEVDGCLGCAVVDLATGLPLAMKVVPGTLLTDDAMEVMAAASVDYFRGRTVWQLELAMSAAGSDDDVAGFVREIQTTTADTYHFMSIVPGREDALLILITDKTANLGLGWIAMRHALACLQDLHESERQPAAASTPAPASPAAATWQHPPGDHQNVPVPAPQPAPQPTPQPTPQKAAGAPVDPPTVDGAPLEERAYSDLRVSLESQMPPRSAEASEMFNPRWRGGRRGTRGRLTR